jgi:hypothetical protein
MRRSINIIKNIKIQPLYSSINHDTEEKKYKSDLEKPRKVKKETNKDEIKYFIHNI